MAPLLSACSYSSNCSLWRDLTSRACSISQSYLRFDRGRTKLYRSRKQAGAAAVAQTEGPWKDVFASVSCGRTQRNTHSLPRRERSLAPVQRNATPCEVGGVAPLAYCFCRDRYSLQRGTAGGLHAGQLSRGRTRNVVPCLQEWCRAAAWTLFGRQAVHRGSFPHAHCRSSPGRSVALHAITVA